MGQYPQPGGEQRSQQQFIVFEQFEKMNTKDGRVGLKETELAWLENLQPIAPNKLLTVPSPASLPLFTFGATIKLKFYATIGGVDYFILFNTDGSAWGVNIATGVGTQFAPAGTFSQAPDLTTWQASRVLINDSIAGYCTWDGTLFVQQGGVSPNITVTNGGQNYGSAPTVTIIANGNTSVVGIVITNAGNFTAPGVGTRALTISAPQAVGGVQAQANAIISGNKVVSVALINGGSGYSAAPTVTLAGITGTAPAFTATLGSAAGTNTTATAVAVVQNGSVVAVNLTNPGTGFLATDAITVTFGSGSGSGAAINATLSGKTIGSLTIGAAGAFSFPTTSTQPLSITGGGGSSAAGTATIAPNAAGTAFQVNAVTLTNPGSGYTSAPSVVLSTTGGSGPVLGATLGTASVASIILASGGTGYAASSTLPLLFTGGGVNGATPANPATGTATTNGSGVVTSVTLTNAGSGYKTAPVVTVAVGSGAAAIAHVWPFIPAGTTLAVFQGRVWLGGGTLLQWTGTGASYGNVGYDDFLAADASGSLQITDADLVHQISALRSLNNYLFIMGDQSVKQIGNISLDATGFVTLFNILTLSSDQGTVYPRSCLSYDRIFMFVAPEGIYGVFGSTVQKLSSDLDGIFKLVDFSQQPQSALLDLNAIHNAVWLLRYRDPAAGTRSIMVIFDGRRWYVTSQGNSIAAICSAPPLANDINLLYGTRTGSDITQLFADPTTAVAFKAQTSLSPHGNALQGKKTVRAGFTADAAGAGSVTVEVDADNSTQNLTFAVTATTLLLGKAVNAAGVNLGITLTGTLANFVLVNMAIEYQDTSLWKGA